MRAFGDHSMTTYALEVENLVKIFRGQRNLFGPYIGPIPGPSMDSASAVPPRHHFRFAWTERGRENHATKNSLHAFFGRPVGRALSMV